MNIFTIIGCVIFYIFCQMAFNMFSDFFWCVCYCSCLCLD